MSLAAITITLAAIAAVAFIAWLWFGAPDDEALDELHRSAMPYDSMHVSLPHCTGKCDGGRSPCKCPTGQTEIANTHSHLHLVRSVPSRPPIQVTGGRVSRWKRLRRFLRAVWDHLTSERWS